MNNTYTPSHHLVPRAPRSIKCRPGSIRRFIKCVGAVFLLASIGLAACKPPAEAVYQHV
jgi:hypothetical protein